MLKLDNINFGYDENLIINDLSIDIKAGECIGIKGGSGSGKSTILRIIAGLEIQKSGRVILNNKDISYIPAFNRNIGYVFQNFALFPHLNVEKNILFGVSNVHKKKRKEKLNKLVEMLEITKYLSRYPHELSGGQKQRVAIARTLITEPLVLLLDEPFSSLDTQLKSKIRLELKEILDKVNITTILVTHDQEDCDVICDRVIDITK